MAGSYNKIILIGNLGRDPETRSLPSVTPVTTFRPPCKTESTVRERALTDEGAAQMQEGEMEVIAALIADSEPPEVGEPGEGTLGHPRCRPSVVLLSTPLRAMRTLICRRCSAARQGRWA